MAKESLYFTHDYGARNDPKLINLQIKHGMAGLGCYWCIVEMLFEEGGEIPLEYERIAFTLRIDTNVIRSIIEDFNLFVFEENMISSKSVLKRIEIRNEKSQKAKESVNHRWDKYKRNTNESEINTNVQKTDTNEGKKDTIKERKGNKGKEIKERKEGPSFPTFSEVDNYFRAMGYTGQEKFYKLYSENDWKDTKGNLVTDWMQKAKDKWFDEKSKVLTSGQPMYR